MNEKPVNIEQRPESDAPIVARPTRWSVITAPWMIFHPKRSASLLQAAGRFDLLLSFAIGVCAVLSLAYVLELDDLMNSFQVIDGRNSHPTLSQAMAASFSGQLLYVNVIAVIVTTGLLIAAALFGGWVIMPTTLGGGSLFEELMRGFRVATGAFGLIVLALMVGILFLVAREFLFSRADYGFFDSFTFRMFMVMQALSFCALVCSLVFWTHRASYVDPLASADRDLPLRCEQCGYDLTHMPESGLCPECGFSAVDSTTPGALRRPRGGKMARDLAAYLNTLESLIRDPAAFYRSIPTRSGLDVALQFANTNYISAGVLASVWLVTCATLDSAVHHLSELVIMIGMPLMMAPSAGWGINRIVAALVTTVALRRHHVTNPVTPRIIVAYESVGLWLLCGFNGVMVTTFFIADNWMSNLFGVRRIWFLGGVPPEFAAMVGGNLCVLAVLIRRYITAFRATRWANF